MRKPSFMVIIQSIKQSSSFIVPFRPEAFSKHFKALVNKLEPTDIFYEDFFVVNE